MFQLITIKRARHVAQQIKSETIGLCEGWCGCVDHHLIDGLCKSCHSRTKTTDTRKNVVLQHENINKFLTASAL